MINTCTIRGSSADDIDIDIRNHLENPHAGYFKKSENGAENRGGNQGHHGHLESHTQSLEKQRIILN